MRRMPIKMETDFIDKIHYTTLLFVNNCYYVGYFNNWLYVS